MTGAVLRTSEQLLRSSEQRCSDDRSYSTNSGFYSDPTDECIVFHECWPVPDLFASLSPLIFGSTPLVARMVGCGR